MERRPSPRATLSIERLSFQILRPSQARTGRIVVQPGQLKDAPGLVAHRGEPSARSGPSEDDRLVRPGAGGLKVAADLDDSPVGERDQPFISAGATRKEHAPVLLVDAARKDQRQLGMDSARLTERPYSRQAGGRYVPAGSRPTPFDLVIFEGPVVLDGQGRKVNVDGGVMSRSSDGPQELVLRASLCDDVGG